MEIYRLEKGNGPSWLYKAYDYARMDSFVFGQGIPLELEFGHDGPAEELEAVVITEDHKPLAGCRIAYPGDGIAKIERVCVIRERQRGGIGRVLIEEAEKWVSENGFSHIIIDSQDRAAAFYERCGYTLASEEDSRAFDAIAKPQKAPRDDSGDHPPAGEGQRIDLGFSCVWVEKYLR